MMSSPDRCVALAQIGGNCNSRPIERGHVQASRRIAVPKFSLPSRAWPSYVDGPLRAPSSAADPFLGLDQCRN